MTAPAYALTTTRRTLYVLDADGNVLARSDGPRGWRYSGRWTLLGLATRYHSRAITPLATAARDGIPGWGVIHDRDHGTHRVWGTERAVSIETLTPQRAADLARVFALPLED